MVDPDDFLPDEEVIEERRPTNCPFCGSSGAFDGQGTYPDMVKIRRSGLPYAFDAEWTQHRCPECNGRFRMLTSMDEEG